MDEEYAARAEVWVLPNKKEILVTDFPGPPASICGYVSEKARAAALARGYATVSEIGFPSECFLGSFALPETGWGEARRVAEAKAKKLGYRVVIESAWAFDDEDMDDHWFDDEEWYGDEEWYEDEDDDA